MRFFRCFTITGVLILLPWTASAAAPNQSFTDILHTLKAIQQLQKDEALAPLNLGVRVRNRVAVLWGPVPSAELAQRAVTRLQAMYEFVEVRNELFVMPEDGRDAPVPVVQPASPANQPEPYREPQRRLTPTEPRPSVG